MLARWSLPSAADDVWSNYAYAEACYYTGVHYYGVASPAEGVHYDGERAPAPAHATVA